MRYFPASVFSIASLIGALLTAVMLRLLAAILPGLHIRDWTSAILTAVTITAVGWAFAFAGIAAIGNAWLAVAIPVVCYIVSLVVATLIVPDVHATPASLVLTSLGLWLFESIAAPLLAYGSVVFAALKR